MSAKCSAENSTKIFPENYAERNLRFLILVSGNGDCRKNAQLWPTEVHLTTKIRDGNELWQKIVPTISDNFAKNWQFKFSKPAFFGETAGNRAWDLVRDANADPMVYKSSKSAFWRRKSQFSIKSVNLGLFLAKVH